MGWEMIVRRRRKEQGDYGEGGEAGNGGRNVYAHEGEVRGVCKGQVCGLYP